MIKPPPVAIEWSERRRFDIAGFLSSFLRVHFNAYDPVFSMTLRYLIRDKRIPLGLECLTEGRYGAATCDMCCILCKVGKYNRKAYVGVLEDYYFGVRSWNWFNSFVVFKEWLLAWSLWVQMQDGGGGGSGIVIFNSQQESKIRPKSSVA
ncbi:hypothetical protein IFM89_003762 [Coptis chinensis]|uniref:Uncharacterized protein n=1 Tax=Coptis chinensis TaxID=261450 RepID=A0A835I9P4_9MAGN|nr:hypothetical protein IFM89_003762 [Coptis chinensis]